MFLSRIFIDKVLPITTAVANYDDYPLNFYKAKSKLYRVSLAPKRNNMFIRIIAPIDSWFCFQIWFFHVLLKWYCNSLLLLSRLTRVTKKKTAEKRRSESKTESATEIVETWVRNGWLLEWPERLGYWILKSSYQHVLIESTMENWISLRALFCCFKITSPRISWLPATEFWLISLVNKRFILMWVHHLSQNKWLFC